MPTNPINAYQQKSKLAITPRAADAQAFSKAARMLDLASKGDFDFTTYSEALHFNQTLWTLIQADLENNAPHISATLRIDIINLSLYVDKQIAKALADPEPGHLGPLIEINRSIARGLSSTTS